MEDKIVIPARFQEKDIPTKKHYWHLILGGQIANRIVGENENIPTRKLDPTFGFIYERALSPKLGLNTGILYQPRSGLNITQSATSIDYGFGRETVTTQLTAERIHYISVPLYLRIRLKGSHSAILGMNYASIFRVSGEKSIKTENSLGELFEEREKIHALSHDFEQRDFALRAGYEYHIFRGTFLGMQAQYSLRNIHENTAAINRKNLFLQFYLRYRFLSH